MCVFFNTASLKGSLILKELRDTQNRLGNYWGRTRWSWFPKSLKVYTSLNVESATVSANAQLSLATLKKMAQQGLWCGRCSWRKRKYTQCVLTSFAWGVLKGKDLEPTSPFMERNGTVFSQKKQQWLGHKFCPLVESRWRSLAILICQSQIPSCFDNGP